MTEAATGTLLSLGTVGTPSHCLQRLPLFPTYTRTRSGKDIIVTHHTKHVILGMALFCTMKNRVQEGGG